MKLLEKVYKLGFVQVLELFGFGIGIGGLLALISQVLGWIIFGLLIFYVCLRVALRLKDRDNILGVSTKKSKEKPWRRD